MNVGSKSQDRMIDANDGECVARERDGRGVCIDLAISCCLEYFSRQIHDDDDDMYIRGRSRSYSERHWGTVDLYCALLADSNTTVLNTE